MRNLLATKTKLQFRYLRLIFFSLLVPTIVVGGCLYYLVFTLVAEEIAIPEFVALILYPAIYRVNMTLLIALPVVFVLLIGWGMVLSHRLAGPIDRFTRELGEVASGNLEKRIRLRKTDELKGAADNVNKILDKLTKE